MGRLDVHASVVGKRFGAYVAVRPLAAGGMAELYLAARVAPGGRGVELGAIKRLLPHLSWDPEFVRMFLAEVRIVAGLVHPNIVRVVDYGTGDGGHYFAMEYVHGETLRRVLRDGSQRSPPLDVAIGVVAELADGLHYAHEFVSHDGAVAGLVHRDVSPSNVMIAHAGAVKLLDFGIARISGRTQHTRAGMVKGKVGYMSPEQCRGERIDRRTDVFGLGILLYELSVGRRAFWAENDFAVIGRILCGEIVPPSAIVPGYPPALEEIVRRALHVDPELRYATAHEMAEDLRGLAAALELDLRPHARASFMRGLFGEAPWPKVDPAIVRRASAPASTSLSGRTRARVAAVAGLVVVVGLAGFMAGNRVQTEDEVPSTSGLAASPEAANVVDVDVGAMPDAAGLGNEVNAPAGPEPTLAADASRHEEAVADVDVVDASPVDVDATEQPPAAEDGTIAGKRAKRRRTRSEPAPVIAPDGGRLLPPSWQQ